MFDGSSYDDKTDIWSLGCVIFSLCNFSHAFDAQTEKRLIEKIRFMQHNQINMSFFQDIYEICVNKDMQTRPSAQDLLGLYLI
jgi:NIMA (never in mitosis gene a)-related kinase